MKSLNLNERHLLLSFKQRIKMDKSLANKSIKVQLDHLFIASPWNGKIYLRTSLMGRLSSWIQYPFEKRAAAIKTYKAFGEAIYHSLSETGRSAFTDFDLKLGTFYREMQQEGIIDPEQSLPSDLTENPELEAMREAQKKSIEKKEQTLFQHSLLRNLTPCTDSPDTLSFKSAFSWDTCSFDKTLPIFEMLLAKYPHYAHPEFKETLGLIKQAMLDDAQIISTLTGTEQPLSEADRNKKLRKLGEAMAKSIQSLDPAHRQKKLLFFSYGRQKLTFEAILRKLSNLPKETLRGMPKILQDIIFDQKIPDPKVMAKAVVKEFFEDMRRSAKAEQTSTDLTVPAFAFSDPTRRIPHAVGIVLPNLFENYLNHFFQDGAIGNLAHFFSEPKLKAAVRWVGNHEELFSGKNVTGNLADELEEKAVSLLESFLQDYVSNFEEKAFSGFKQAAQNVSPEMLQLLGLDSLALSGPIWLEFQKQEDGHYELAVYSLGNALTYHPIDAASKQPFCIKRLKDIPEENLTSYFFQNLLSRHLEPLWNPQSSPMAQGIYEGLQSLGGKDTPNHAQDNTVRNYTQVSDSSMAAHLLFHDHTAHALPLFDIYVDMLLKYCSLFMKEDSLVIPNDEVCSSLEMAVNKISKESTLFGQQKELQDKMSAIKTTVNEINHAINLFKSTKIKNKRLSSTLKDTFQQLGLTVGMLEKTSDFARWALGDEVGELLDYIVANYKDILPTDQANLTATQSNGIFHSKPINAGSFLGIYSAIALKFSKLICAVLGLYFQGFWLLLDAPFLLSILPMVLPPAILYWYNRVMTALKLTIVRMALHAIWKFALPQQMRTNITNAWEEWQSNFKEVKNVLEEGYLFSLPTAQSKTTYEQDIDEKEISFDIQSRLPKSNVKPSSIHHIATESVDDVDNKKIIKTIDSLPKMPPLNSSNALPVLQEWLEFCQTCDPCQAAFFLSQQLSALETPSRTRLSIWDDIKDPQECAEVLSDLSCLMFDKIKAFDNHISSTLLKDKAHYMAAMYNVQAILWCLGQRLEIDLKGLPIYAAPLAVWYCTPDTGIDDPVLLKRIEAIFGYLLPNFDLSDPPNLKNWLRKQHNTLFSPLIATTRKNKDTDNDELLLIEIKTELSPSSQYIYFLNLFQKKEVQEKIKALGIEYEPSSVSVHLNTPLSEKIALFMFQESLVFTRPDPLVPRTFSLLALQNIACSELASEEFNPAWEKRSLKLRKEDRPPQYDENFFKKVHSFFLWMHKSGVDLTFLVPIASQFPQAFTAPATPENRSAYDDLTLYPRTQTSVYQNASFYDEADPTAQQLKNLKIIWSESPEKIIQLINYIKRKCKTNEEMFALCLFLKKVIFTPRELNALMDKSPQAIQALGEVFDELLQSLLKEDRFFTFVMVAETAIKVREYCSFYHPESRKLFPDIQKKLDLMQQKRGAVGFSNHPISFLRTLDLLREPQSVDVLEERNIIIALLTFWFNRSFSDECSASISTIYYMLMKWLPTIQTALDDPNERKFILDALMEKRGIKLSAKEGVHWIETAKGIYQRDKIVVNFSNGTITIPNALNFPLKSMQGDKTLNDLLGTVLQQINPIAPDLFATSDGTFEIKVIPTKASYSTFLIVELIKNKEYLFLEKHVFNPSLDDQLLFWSIDYGIMMIQNKNRPDHFIRIAYKTNDQGGKEIKEILTEDPHSDTLLSQIHPGLILNPSEHSLPLNEEKPTAKDEQFLLETSLGKNITNQLTSSSPHLYTFKTENIEISAEARVKLHQEQMYEIIQRKNGIVYQYHKHASYGEEHKNIYNALDAPSTDCLSFWIEQTGQFPKKLLIQNMKDHSKFIITSYDPANPNPLLAQNPEVLKNPTSKPTRVLVPLAADKFAKEFRAIFRFCSLDNIRCMALEGTQQIFTILLKPYHLTFEVNSQGEACIKSSAALDGYFIAKQQTHESLQGIGSYLLLENKGGKKKVLIDKNQWPLALLGRASSITGPFGQLITDHLSRSINTSGNSSEYYVFDIEDNTSSSQSMLHTDDPLALAYLLIIYLCQGKHEMAEQTCKKIEWMCRSRAIDPSIWKQLFLLSLGFEFEGIGYLRKRLFSAMAQNQEIFGSCSSPASANNVTKKLQDDPSDDLKWSMQNALIAFADDLKWSMQNALIAFVILSDLKEYIKNPNPRYPLTHNQEYFLFRCAFLHLEKILMQHVGKSEDILKILQNIGVDTFIEASGLAPELILRYRKLREESGLPPSKWIPVFDYAKEIYKGSQDQGEGQALGQGNASLTSSFNNFFKIINKLKDNQFFDLKIVNPKELYEKTRGWIIPYPTIAPEKLTPTKLKISFVTYYAIARGDFPYKDPITPGKPLPTVQQLQRMIKLTKGQWDPQCDILFSYLENVIAAPNHFPPTADLLKALKFEGSNTQWTESGEWEEKEQTDLSPPATAFPQKALEKFFEKLNNQSFLSYFNEGCFEFLEQYVDQFYRHSLLAGAISGPIRTLVGQTIAQTNLGGVGGLAAQVVGHVVTQYTTDTVASALKPLEKYIPAPSAYFHGDSNLSAIGKAVIPSAAAIGISYLGRYAAKRMASQLPPICQAVFQSGPTTLTQRVGAAALAWGCGIALNYTFARLKNRSFGWKDAVPLPAITIPTARWLGKKAIPLKNSIIGTIIPKPVAAPLEEKQPVPVDYSVLQKEMKAIDHYLDELFNDVFVEELSSETLMKEEEDSMTLFSIDDKLSPIQKERYERVNASIKAYYAQKDKRATSFTVKNEKGFTGMYISLLAFRQAFGKQVDGERSDLLNIFNAPHLKLNAASSLTMEDIHRLIEKEDIGKLGAEIYFKDEMMPQLKLAVARIDLKLTKLQQIDRLLATLQELSKQPGDSFAYYEKLEQLAVELNTRLVFSLSDTPERLLRLNFEFQTKTKLNVWLRQFENKRKILYGQDRNVVTEEPPGDGKTDYGIPLAAAHESHGKKLVMPIAPAQLAGDNQAKISAQLRSIFNKHSHVLRFSRDKSMSNETLEAIIVLMNYAIKDGEPIQLTKEDALSLKAIFTEHLHNYYHNKNGKSHSAEKTLILLHKILSLVYLHGLALPDESHETYRHKHKLNFPIGKSNNISDDSYDAMEAAMRLISRDPEIYQMLASNKLIQISEDTYTNEIKPRLAAKMSKYFRIDDPIKEKQFIAFICDSETKVPQWITRDAKFYKKASMAKGVFGELMRINLQNRVDVNYGASKAGNGQFARPGGGNSYVVEEDSIQSPYETLVKTFIMLLHKGLSVNQFHQIKEHLKQQALKEMKKNPKITFKQTKVYHKFGKHLTAAVLNDARSPDIAQQAYKALYKDPDICLIYVRHFIRKEITYWNKSIQNSAHDFANMFSSQYSCTGTPYNDGTYPAQLKVLRDPATIGEMLHIISQKCPDDGIHILDAEKPAGILNEILNNFFANGSKFSAIIDGGAQFTGMANETVAKRMIKFCEEKRHDIKAVKFYKKDPSGKERVYCFLKGSAVAVPVDAVQIAPEHCLTYYDERHGFGADIKQTGHGFETLGPKHPLYKWLQELFRIRGLKKPQRLKAIQEKLLSIPMQQIHLGMTKEVQRMILGASQSNETMPIPTLAEIIDYTILNEAAIAEQENYPSMREKIASVPKRAIYNKIMATPSEQFHRWAGVWKEFEDLDITTIEDDPSKIFGLIRSEVAPETALEASLNGAYQSIARSSSFTKQEKQKLKEEMRSIERPLMPSKVVVWSAEKGAPIQIDAMDNLNAQQTIQTSAQQTSAMNVQQNQTTQTQAQIQMQQEESVNLHKPGFRYSEWKWPNIIDPASTQWLKFSKPNKETLFLSSISLLGSKVTCPFYRVQDLLIEASSKTLNKVAPYFDKRLWMPNNFVPQKVRGFFEKSADIGSSQQFDLFEVLIHLKQNAHGKYEIEHMGPLSLRDSAMWREKLSSDDEFWQGQTTKTILWDVSSRTVQAGCPIDQNILREIPDLNLLIGQLKLLDGQTDLIPSEEKVIEKWLLGKKMNAIDVKKAFEFIFEARKKPNSELNGSIVQNLFLDVTPDDPFEAQL